MVPYSASEEVRHHDAEARELRQHVGALQRVGRHAEDVVDADESFGGRCRTGAIEGEGQVVAPSNCEGVTGGYVVGDDRRRGAACCGEDVCHV